MGLAAPAWAFVACPANLAAALDDLMWVIQAEREHFSERIQIRGYLKPPPGLLSEAELLDGCADRYEDLLDILDQAGVGIYQQAAVPEWRPDGFRVGILIEFWDTED